MRVQEDNSMQNIAISFTRSLLVDHDALIGPNPSKS